MDGETVSVSVDEPFIFFCEDCQRATRLITTVDPDGSVRMTAFHDDVQTRHFRDEGNNPLAGL